MMRYGLLMTLACFAFSLAAQAQAPAGQLNPPSAGLSRTHYLCSGIRVTNPKFTLEEGVACFNPSPREAQATCTFFTAGAEPKVLNLTLKPNGKTWLRGYPKESWGMKIESTVPITAQGFVEYFSVAYNTDYTKVPESQRGINQYSTMSVWSLGRSYYLPDLSTSPRPETLWTVEKNWYTVCNPNKTEAKLVFKNYMGKEGTDTREITVPAERISHFEMTEIGMKPIIGGAMEIQSDQPIAILQTRAIEGTPMSKFNNVRFSVFQFMLQP